jgi:hypothetical protein
MKVSDLAARLESLEREVARLKLRGNGGPDPYSPWWREIAGEFADDPDFEEAVRLGREYRESLQPKRKQRKAHSRKARS